MATEPDLSASPTAGSSSCKCYIYQVENPTTKERFYGVHAFSPASPWKRGMWRRKSLASSDSRVIVPVSIPRPSGLRCHQLSHSVLYAAHATFSYI